MIGTRCVASLLWGHCTWSVGCGVLRTGGACGSGRLEVGGEGIEREGEAGGAEFGIVLITLPFASGLLFDGLDEGLVAEGSLGVGAAAEHVD